MNVCQLFHCTFRFKCSYYNLCIVNWEEVSLVSWIFIFRKERMWNFMHASLSCDENLHKIRMKIAVCVTDLNWEKIKLPSLKKHKTLSSETWYLLQDFTYRFKFFHSPDTHKHRGPFSVQILSVECMCYVGVHASQRNARRSYKGYHRMIKYANPSAVPMRLGSEAKINKWQRQSLRRFNDLRRFK